MSHLFEAKNIRFSLWYFYIPLSVLWTARFLSGHFLPKDDLLRHAVAYRWGYDYAIPYLESIFQPSFDYYLGFDLAVGFLHRHLGDCALLFPQLFAMSLTFWSTAKLLKEVENPIKVMALAVLIKLIYGRFILGRPSVVCSAIMLFLLAYNGELKTYGKIIISLISTPLYYLFFIYLGPLVLFDRKYLISLALGGLFWFVYSGGSYLSEIYRVVASLNQQNMAVAENKTIIVFFISAWVFALPMLHHWRKDIKTAALVAFFSLSNQVRYVETLVPLVLSFFRFSKGRVPMIVAIGLASYLMLSMAPLKSPLMSEIPKHLPEKARVLADNMGAMYQLLYQRPDLKVSPSYAYGWTEREVQDLLKEIMSGTLNCGSNTVHRFDYFVESSLRGKTPGCLEIIAMEKERRLWKIVR